METLVMLAAHGGYDSESVPLGGGAAICERLCRAWAGRDVLLVGSGPVPPTGIEYVRVDLLGDRHPATLSELRYARFCRGFERAVTDFALRLAARKQVRVLTHDLCEGPDFARLARAGVPCVPILHVDVVEFFCRQYLHGWVRPDLATRWHRRLRRLPWPDVLRLVFDKQADAVEHCPGLVVPSAGMVRVLERCYPGLDSRRVEVVPWGYEPPAVRVRDLDRQAVELRRRWLLGEQGPVLVTLSRISPEKGHDLLLDALRHGEQQGLVPEGTTLLVLGSAAYMGGAAYRRKLEAMSRTLRRTRVLFAGHLGGVDKQAALSLATLMVVPSRHESYGLTTVEAMGAGVPVVAVRTHGTEATLARGGGVLVEPGRDLPRRLWQQLHELLNNPARRLELASQGVRLARQETFSAASERLYQYVMGLSVGIR